MPRLIALLAVLGVAASDWLDDYGLSAHRGAFEQLGITAADLATLSADAGDVEALKQPMKKYEKLRFDQALQLARTFERDRLPAAPAAPKTLSFAVDRAARTLSVTPTPTRVTDETQLKQALLAGYDKSVPPGVPVPVSLGINLYHIYSLDMRRATLILHLWLRLGWVDPRLSWDPSLHGGIDQVTFIASAASPLEESQIWVPEVELYSGAMSAYNMPRKEVTVWANGTAFWSRPGEVTSVCQLDGLQDFPFDVVRCPMRFGGWSLGGSVQNLSLPAAPLPAIDMQLVRDATFQEYRVKGATAYRGADHSYACCPDEAGWPYVEFEVSLERAEKHYDMKLVMMNIVLTYLSCGVFLLDPRTGERLQFSTTILLTVVAADSLVTGVVPVCMPVLWIEYFFLVCWSVCVLAIIGNMLTHWLYWKSPPEVYASGMPRAHAFHEWIGSKLHRRKLAFRRGSSEEEDAAAGAAQPQMWRGESDFVSAPGSPLRSPMGSSNSVLGVPGGGGGGVPGGILRRGRSSTHLVLRRVPTNPFLEPNTPALRRQRSSARAPHNILFKASGGDSEAAQHRAGGRLDGGGGGGGLHAAHDRQRRGTCPRSRAARASRRGEWATSVDQGRHLLQRRGRGRERRRPASSGSAAAAGGRRGRGRRPEQRQQGGGDGGTGPEMSVRSKFRKAGDKVISNNKRGGADGAASGGSSCRRRYNRMSRLASVLIRERNPDLGERLNQRKRGNKLGAVAPFEGAFVGSEELAAQVTAVELDPVQAALVRKAFRLLDSMSSSLGVLGPNQMRYFANHVGRLPKTKAGVEKAARNEEDWHIEEFSELCLALIKNVGDEKFRVLVEGLLESYEYKEKLHKIYWEGWALWWDYVCFTLLTLSYTVALVTLAGSMRQLEVPAATHAM